MAVITLAAVVAATGAGCFPTNTHARHLAYAAEAATIIAGVVVLGLAKPGGDCLRTDTSCKAHADEESGAGLVLLFAGLAGFVVTAVSAQDAPATTTAPAATAPSPSVAH